MGNRTRADMDALDDAILDVLEEDNPQSVRHTFYRLVDVTRAVYVDKTEAGYRQVMRRISLMREDGRLPWSWIVDMSRRRHRFTGWDGVNDNFIESVQAMYRRDYWAGGIIHMEVWAESRSIASVLMGECSRAGIDLYPAGGFSSSTFIHESAVEIANTGKEYGLDSLRWRL